MKKNLLKKFLSLLFTNFIGLAALFSLVFIFVYKFWLINIPEFVSFGSELGDLLYNIVLAYIGSFIFYIVVNFLPEEKNKLHVYDFVYRKFDLIIREANGLFGNMIGYVYAFRRGWECSEDLKNKTLSLFNYDLKIEELNEENFKKLFEIITPDIFGASFFEDREGNPINEETNFHYFLVYVSENIKNYIQSILVLTPHLESEHINILMKIQDLDLFQSINRTSIQLKNNRTVNYYYYPKKINEFYHLINSLKQYREDK